MINLGKMRRDHARFLVAQARCVEVATEEAGRDAMDHAREHTGYRNRTGTLTEANSYKVYKYKGKSRVRIFNKQPYAAAIDKGAAPHEIKARRKPYLVFYWAKMSRWVRVKSVRHPGNKPYKFLSNATLYAFTNMQGRLARDIAEAARKF